MHDLGFLSEREVRIDETKIIPRRALQRLFEPNVRLPGGKDVVVLRVESVREKNGKGG